MNINRILSLLILPILSLVFQGCSESNFSGIDAGQKLEALEGHTGLGNDSQDLNTDNGLTNPQNDGGNISSPPINTGFIGMDNMNGGIIQNDNGMGNTPQNDGGMPQVPQNDGPGKDQQGDDGLAKNPQDDSGIPFDKKDDPVTTPNTGRFRIVRWCRGRDHGATLKEATNIKIVLKDRSTKKVICDATGTDLLDQAKTSGQVDIPNCDFSQVSNHNLVAEVTNQDGKSLSDGVENGYTNNAFDDSKVKGDNGSSRFDAVALHLLLDKDVSMRNVDEDCDAYNSSPLVVDMRSSKELKKIFELSAPSEGVEFDILGLNSTPSAYTPKQISWMKDPRIMPIVLPKNKSVDGVNELFGDNTLGPDGDFAKDGFHALAKYDGLNLRTNEVNKKRKDGYINKKDQIYSKLRVWYDRNLDGVADAKELYTLRKAGITVIDLNYDESYYSRDQYGNEIKYKSVVKLKSGKLKPVFDIWFTVNKLIQKQ